ncbi:MAG: sugar ABC transporter permease [Dorea sp.]|jgi:multiple sugar transport system permease protein|nr:sugar ABC transporter permease [Dorea sp.]
MKNKPKNWAWAYMFLAPSVILICILNLWPILQTLWFSLNDIQGFQPPKWAGLGNYITVLGNEEFAGAFKNTVVYTLVTVPAGVFLSLVTAVLLNTSIRCKGFFRICYFLPVISAPAAVAMVWRWLYNSEFGIINFLLSKLGIDGLNWIGDSKTVLLSVMIVGIWAMVGYNMVILLAGLQNIPRTFYEAAEIDGASGYKKFMYITVPLVSPTLFFVILTTTISSLQVFDHIYMMVDSTNPALKSAQSLVYLFYKYTFVQYDKGIGSAFASLLLGLVLILTCIQMYAQKKWVIYQ